MIINTNMNALNAHRNMGINNTQAGKSMEKLSSGLRINRAGDDAAGLAISEKMRGQIRGLDQASRNAQDGISMIQTAEGALNETHNILQRMRELTVQSSNDTNTADDRKQIQEEINQLTQEIDRIGNNTEFNTQKLLKGDGGVALDKTGKVTEQTTAGSPQHTQASATTTIGTGTGVAGDKLTVTIGGKEISVELKADTLDEDATAAAFRTALTDAISKDEDLKGNFTITGSDDKITITANANGKFDGAEGTISNSAVTGTGTGVGTTTSTAGVGTTTQNAATANIEFGSIAVAGQTVDQTLKNITDMIGKGFEINGQKVEFYNVNDGAYKGEALGIDLSKVMDAAKAGTAAGLTGPQVTAVQDAFTKAVADQVGNKLEGITITAGATGQLVVSTKETGANAKLDIKDGAVKKEFEASFQVGANEGQKIDVSISDMRAEALGVDKIDASSKESATKAITTVDDAIKNVSAERSKLGAVQNRLEYTTSNLNNTSENLTAAESRIRDVDMAKEMLNFSKNNILNQAAQSMLAQAKSQPEGVLQLLR